MKKLLLVLCALCTAVVMNAGVVEIDFTSKGYENAQEITFVEQDGITLTFDAGGNNNSPRYYNTGTAVRLYGKNTMTVTSTVGNIVSIEFTVHSSNPFDKGFTFEPGEFKNNTWTGDAESMTVTNGNSSGHVRIQKMTITTKAEGEVIVPMPTASVEAGTYYEPQTVELTAEEGCTIIYTLNGGEEQTYTTPITISENTTLVAWAVDKDGNKSGELTVVYEFAVSATGTLASAIASADNDVTIIGEELTVVYQYGDYLYVKAGDTYGLIYKKGGVGITYNAGDVIAAGVAVKKTTYNDLIELIEPEGLTEGVAGTPVEPVATNTLECSSSEWVNKYIVIAGATYHADTKILEDAEGEIALYKRFATDMPATDMNNVTVVGIMGVYKGTYQLQPISIEGDAVEPQTPDDPTEPTEVLVIEGNLLENGSFEAWADGVPENWKSTTTASSATLSAVTTKDAHTGTSAVQLAAATSNKRLAYRELELEPGVYVFSFFARAAESDTETKLVPGYAPLDEATGKLGTYVYSEEPVTGLTTEYQEVRWEFTLTEKATINLVIRQDKNTASTIIDDAALVKTAEYDAVAGVKAIEQQKVIYTIGGVRVQNVTRGLYVVDGKKVLK